MTSAEFLAWEERQEDRFGFDGFRPVAMTGGTVAHEVIGQNLRTDLGNRLRGSRCQTLGSNTKIELSGRIRYPDALVVCSPLDRKATVITNPSVVFEVLSDSTARIDQFDKLREYTAAPSIRRYVILDQDQIAATVFVRDGDRWWWKRSRAGTYSSCRKSRWRSRSMISIAGWSRRNPRSANSGPTRQIRCLRNGRAQPGHDTPR